MSSMLVIGRNNMRIHENAPRVTERYLIGPYNIHEAVERLGSMDTIYSTYASVDVGSKWIQYGSVRFNISMMGNQEETINQLLSAIEKHIKG